MLALAFNLKLCLMLSVSITHVCDAKIQVNESLPYQKGFQNVTGQ